MVPWVPWYTTHPTPGTHIAPLPYSFFSKAGSFRWAPRECSPSETPGKHVFSRVRSGFYCVRRALTRDPGHGSRESGIGHQTNRRVFPPFCQNPRNPEK